MQVLVPLAPVIAKQEPQHLLHQVLKVILAELVSPLQVAVVAAVQVV